ncbi:Transcription factor fungi [Macrophomina phaseolina MS6]|uniref:Transcription factor fungi n=1 Tax=Macrophomina phaseolina (strain MS6) TaxID=1126212 RepID=K2S7S1_MACPH|nr:Transcription factor fungi [Macrophomina phaseolina MS6]
MATRVHDRTRRVWTLLSLAVRVAHSLSLHAEPPGAHATRPFERELRRRLWCAIALLDTQTTLECVSEPMIQGTWLQAPNLPLNIDDLALIPDSEGEPVEAEGFSDMTFTLVACRAQCVARLLNFPAPVGSSAVSNWDVRQNYVEDFARSIGVLLRRNSCASERTGPTFYRWYTDSSAEVLIATMQLIAVRPLRQLQPCDAPPQVKGANLLRLATEVLRKTQSLAHDPRGTQWHWLEAMFPPWHALAVALAELCVCDDPTLCQDCWPAVKLAFAQLSHQLAEPAGAAIIWGPMERLMKQARQRMERLHMYSPPIPSNPLIPGSQQETSFSPFMTPISSSLDLCALTDLAAVTEADFGAADAWGNWESFIQDMLIGREFALCS